MYVYIVGIYCIVTQIRTKTCSLCVNPSGVDYQAAFIKLELYNISMFPNVSMF